MKQLDLIKSYLTHKYDPEDLIELLEISTETLLERYEDAVLAKMPQILELVEEDIIVDDERIDD